MRRSGRLTSAIEGMDVADTIAAVPVDGSDAPLTPIVLTAYARE